MKYKLILKSLADLPGDTLAFAASMPGRAFDLTRSAVAPPVRATRRQIRAARQKSMQFMRDFYDRASTPLHSPRPWVRGGINE